ncbi:MAG: WG repeat-containing protein [Muribaculaceae bacterium]|nr:WG repeat-containing protein [Muribaculaceae bacterium]
MDGKQLYSTDQRLTKFYEGLATVINKESSDITGVVDTAGNFISLPNLSMIYNYPHFENGYLVAKRKGKYAMYSKDGKERPLPELTALYPFSNGYAIYMAYENPEKMKKPFYNYIKTDGSPLEHFILKEKNKEKQLEPKDVTFLSAVDKDGKAIAIVKNKLYSFDGTDASLSPILMGDESEKKRHLTLIADKERDFTEIGNGKFKFSAKYGKDQTEDFEFDSQLRPLSDGKVKNYDKKRAKESATDFNTAIESYQDGQLYGLIYDGQDSIPCQFESIGVRYGKKAFVKSKGKWGVLEFMPDIRLAINLNNGEEIAFTHKDFPTQLRIDFPISILSKNVRVIGSDTERCSIDMDSRDHKDTREGNYVVYKCNLSVPTNLTDSVSDISFGPIELMCDNIKLHPLAITAKGRYVRPYSIELASKDLSVNQNGTEFNVIVYSETEADGEEYPYGAKLESDVLETVCEKLSDRNYKCKIEYIEEGTYDMEFVVTETGCPPCVFPMEITCTKKGKATLRLKVPGEEVQNDSTVVAGMPGKGETAVGNAAKAKGKTASANLKRPVLVKFEDDYFAGEVIAQEPILVAGPGADYPAPTYYVDNMGTKEIPAPYKGQIIKVKDEGEWYLKYPSVPASQNPQPEYIAKNSVHPVKSKPFAIKRMTQPCIYATTHEIFDEANNKQQYIDQVVTYPGGFCVEYSEGKLGALVKFGNIVDGNPAIQWRYRIQTRDGGEVPEGSKSSVAIDNTKSMHRMRLTVAPQDKKTYKGTDREIAYIDITSISADDWTDILKDYLLTADLQYDNHEVQPYECDILTQDMLEKNYTKVTE